MISISLILRLSWDILRLILWNWRVQILPSKLMNYILSILNWNLRNIWLGNLSCLLRLYILLIVFSSFKFKSTFWFSWSTFILIITLLIIIIITIIITITIFMFKILSIIWLWRDRVLLSEFSINYEWRKLNQMLEYRVVVHICFISIKGRKSSIFLVLDILPKDSFKNFLKTA